MSSPVLGSNLIHRDLNCISVPLATMLVYYTDNFMLMRHGEQEAATDLDTIVNETHACQRVGNKSHKNSGLPHW